MLDWKIERRKQAFRLRELGWTHEQIAVALGVSRSGVSRWLAGPRDPAAWGGKGRAGRPPRLSRTDLNELLVMLRAGAETCGFRGEVWTAPRVVALIHDHFGVTFDRSWVTQLLRKLGWTPQRPVQRASQRNETAIVEWRETTWPALKRGRPAKNRRLSVSTNPLSTPCPDR